MKLIFVLESPPKSGVYFYDPEGRTTEPLFSAMMKIVDCEAATKQEGLAVFSHKGFFLVNATYNPVNHINNNRERNKAILSDLPELIQDLKRNIGNPRVKIVLVKANICRLLEEPLKKAGFSVMNNGMVIPFPSHGNQNKFHQIIRKVLSKDQTALRRGTANAEDGGPAFV